MVTGQFLLDICPSNFVCSFRDENFSAIANCMCGLLGFVVKRFGLWCVCCGGAAEGCLTSWHTGSAGTGSPFVPLA